MRKKFIKRAGGFFSFALILFLFPLTINAKYIIENQSILEEKASKKIETIGEELYTKTKVNVYLVALNTLDGKQMIDYELEVSKKLNKPYYVLLTFSLNDSKVDIISSDNMKDKFDKEAVLSPYPWKGSIIPLLTSKAKSGKYEAALLNGYADITDRVAESYGVVLENSVGDSNKTTINIIRFIFYFIIVVALLYIFYMKIFKKGLFAKK